MLSLDHDLNFVILMWAFNKLRVYKYMTRPATTTATKSGGPSSHLKPSRLSMSISMRS